VGVFLKEKLNECHAIDSSCFVLLPKFHHYEVLEITGEQEYMQTLHDILWSNYILVIVFPFTINYN